MADIEIVGVGSAWVNRVTSCHKSYLESQQLSPGSVIKVDAERYRALCDHRVDQLQYVGGSVANTLVALSGLGRGAGFLGKATMDGDGLFFLNDLVSRGVKMLVEPTDHDHATSGCFYYHDHSGGVTKVVHLGASATLGFADMSMQSVIDARCLLIEADVLDMPKSTQWLVSMMDLAKKNNTVIVLVLSNKHVVARHREFLLSMLSCVDMVAGNEIEFEVLTNTQSEKKITEVCQIGGLVTIMTQGRNGSIIAHKGKVVQMNSLSDPAIDTTAAGDYYLAGIIHAHLAGKSYAESINLASAMAAKICAERGSRCFSLADLQECAAFYV